MEKTSDFYNLKVGENKVRILTLPVSVYKLNKGVYPNNEFIRYVDDGYRAKEGEKVDIKGWVWAIIRETGELKIVTLPYSVIKLIQQLKDQEDYAFDEYPMPYDITISNSGVGAARYTLTAARKNTPITEQELESLEFKTPIEDIVRRMKEKVSKVEIKKEVKTVDYPEFEGEPPF